MVPCGRVEKASQAGLQHTDRGIADNVLCVGSAREAMRLSLQAAALVL